jgi:hypothetical protein
MEKGMMMQRGGGSSSTTETPFAPSRRSHEDGGIHRTTQSKARAIAATTKRKGIEKIAILDLLVHDGNIFQESGGDVEADDDPHHSS